MHLSSLAQMVPKTDFPPHQPKNQSVNWQTAPTSDGSHRGSALKMQFAPAAAVWGVVQGGQGGENGDASPQLDLASDSLVCPFAQDAAESTGLLGAPLDAQSMVAFQGESHFSSTTCTHAHSCHFTPRSSPACGAVAGPVGHTTHQVSEPRCP